MLRATESWLAPEITATLMSMGLLPSAGVIRNSRSPLDSALPDAAIFQLLASGGPVAAAAAAWVAHDEAATRAAMRQVARFMMPSSHYWPARPGPDLFKDGRGALTDFRPKAIRLPP